MEGKVGSEGQSHKEERDGGSTVESGGTSVLIACCVSMLSAFPNFAVLTPIRRGDVEAQSCCLETP